MAAWYGEPFGAVPVRVTGIAMVGALMKEGGCRSFANYVGRAKDAHVQAGYLRVDRAPHAGSEARHAVGNQGPGAPAGATSS